MTDQLLKDISYLLDEGISLIATKEDKRPASNWKARGKLNAVELSDDLFQFKTECVAIRLGEQSKGLMCIDIDEKHNLGISKRFFDDFKIFFPELWNGIRIEKTPSGGFHVFFRKDGFVPNTEFVGYRATTDEEKVSWIQKWREANAATGKKEPKPPSKESFLEIRGQEGLCQTYPSIGYKVVKEAELDLGGFCTIINDEEFEAIKTFCCSFNEVIPQERAVEVKGKIQEEDWYDVNPFADFDDRDEGKILEEQGWKFQKSSGGKDWYSKPGRSGKSGKDIDAWYNSEKKFYNIFSTNCGIDAKGYSPANLLSQLKFDGNKKKMWAYLVETGYGKLKKSIEEREIRKRVLDGKPLMKNISEEGKKIYEEEKGKRDENYPYGIFWEIGAECAVKINLESLLIVSNGLGFRIYRNCLCRINFGIIEIIEPRAYFDYIKNYIKVDGIDGKDIYDSYERILHTYGKTIISRLKEIPESDVIKSEKYKSYKFFKNCFIEINREELIVKEYKEIEDGKLIMDDQVQKRNFFLLEQEGIEKYNGTLYYDFLTKAIVSEKQGIVDKYVMKCIGFMTHDYKDQESFLMGALEADQEVGGGSGKNIFYQTLGHNITYMEIAASQIKNDNTFLQSWNRQRLVHISDVPKKYDMSWLKNIIDQGVSVRKLYKDEFRVEVHDAPKIVFSSNFSIDTTDVGIKRRLRQIEFTDYFIRVGGVREHYGKMFCDDWTEEDFMYYDNFIMECLQLYLFCGGRIDKKDFTETGLVKQFEQTFNYLHDFIKDNIESWISKGFISTAEFNKLHDDFCKENKIYKSFSPNSINKALRSYCENNKISYIKDDAKRENGVLVRGRHFGEKTKEIKDDMPF